MDITTDSLILDYNFHSFTTSIAIHADCFEWMSRIPEASLHAIVTDPPYGVKEYNFEQIEKRANGNGGIWRIPPSFDGSNRSPLPRFTALTEKDRAELFRFFPSGAKLRFMPCVLVAICLLPVMPFCPNSYFLHSSPVGWNSAVN